MIIDLFVYTHTFVGCGFEYRCGWHALMREKWARFQSLYILSLVCVNVLPSKVEFRYSGSKLSLMQRVALCHVVLLSWL